MENEKIKVLEVLHGLAHGGIESFVMSITENIDKDKFQVDYALATDYPQFHEERVLSNGNRIFKTKNLGSLKDDFTHLVRLTKLIRRERYDVVHAHIDYFNGVNMLAAWLGGAKIRICHSHCTKSANAKVEDESLLVKTYHTTMRVLINAFATVKAGCSMDANRWLYGKTNGCQVICNAIDQKRFDKQFYDRVALQKQYGIDQSKTNIITVGRIVESKNPVFLARVICEYAKLDDNFHFHWISTGRLQNEVEAILAEGHASDKVTFWGVRKDVPELLACMDYFVFPSLWEGLGIVLVEAQAMGLKCFVSDKIPEEADLGGLRTIPLNLGEQAWAAEIHRQVLESGKGFSINAEKFSEYDVRNMIHKVEKLYSGE